MWVGHRPTYCIIDRNVSLVDVVVVHVLDDALQVVGGIDGDGLAVHLDVVDVVAVLDEAQNLDVLDRLDLGLAILLAVVTIELQGLGPEAVHAHLLVVLHIDVALGEGAAERVRKTPRPSAAAITLGTVKLIRSTGS